MINELLLLSGNDIPFTQAQISIHQPTINQISYIGQENFLSGCQYLNFSKQKINNEKDKNHLQDFTDFQILMTIIRDNKNSVAQTYKICIELLLLLLFPQYQINFLPMGIMISKTNKENQIERHIIDQNNFEKFKIILKQIFCFAQLMNSPSDKYNPGGPQSRALVQKFKKRQQQLAKLKNHNKQKSNSIFSRYISILAVGEKKDINQLLNYTVYQLLDEFSRFKLKENFDMYVQAKMAGATNLEESKNWMDDIHSQDTL